MSQISKHTIEVEVEVHWDANSDSNTPHCLKWPINHPSEWHSTGGMALIGITRPKPPYEPQVGDIVTYTGRVNFYQVSGHHDDGDVELMCANKSILFKIPPDKLTFIARP
jgi:hypothetical protein